MNLSKLFFVATSSAISLLLCSCGNLAPQPSNTITQNSTIGKPLANFPTVEARAQQIASESSGSYFIGRRYFVDRTSFWGYVRKPRQPWSTAKLVVINEDRKLSPDRLPADGPTDSRFGYDQNYEYQLFGSYTGKKVYEPNSNQFLPEFKLTNYRLTNKKPGWLFSPKDRYHPKHISLLNPHRIR